MVLAVVVVVLVVVLVAVAVVVLVVGGGQAGGCCAHANELREDLVHLRALPVVPHPLGLAHVDPARGAPRVLRPAALVPLVRQRVEGGDPQEVAHLREHRGAVGRRNRVRDNEIAVLLPEGVVGGTQHGGVL